MRATGSTDYKFANALANEVTRRGSRHSGPRGSTRGTGYPDICPSLEFEGGRPHEGN
jgi:hypothetical protein